MDRMAKHTQAQRHAATDDRPPQTHARAAAWVVLSVAGVTMISFNMWHALHGGIPEWFLAALVGVAPVVIAMGLSHVVSAYGGGWFMKAATFAIMLGAMALSVRATGYVVHPALGALWWLFGGTIDSAALVALQVVMSPESRAAAKAAKRTAREALLNATLGAAAEATGMPPAMPSAEPAGEPLAVPSQRSALSQRAKAVRVSKEPDAERARAEFRKSVRAGAPLSDRALGEMFGRSRTWGAARIRETEAGPRPVAAAR